MTASTVPDIEVSGNPAWSDLQTLWGSIIGSGLVRLPGWDHR
jgi:hypothetical protein